MKWLMVLTASVFPLLVSAQTPCQPTNSAPSRIACVPSEAVAKKHTKRFLFEPRATLASEQVLSEIDAIQAMSTLLARQKTFPVSETCSNVAVGQECRTTPPSCTDWDHNGPGGQHCRTVCSPILEMRCSEVQGHLSAVAPAIVDRAPAANLRSPDWDAVRSQVIGYRERYSNCGLSAQKLIFRHTSQVLTGNRYVVTRSVKMGAVVSVRLEGHLYDPVVGKSIDISRYLPISESSQASEQAIEVLDRIYEIDVPPMTAMKVEHSWIWREPVVEFAGNIGVDASVSSNRANIRLVSQVVPLEQGRLLDFGGYVATAYAVEKDPVKVSTPLDPTTCAGRSDVSRDSAEAFGN